MIDADGVDLVLGPGWIRVKDTAWNLLGFVAGVLQRDGFGCFDRKKLRSAARSRGRSDRGGSDPAIERADREVGVDSGVLRKLFDFVGPELNRRNLVRFHAGGDENGA